MEEHHNSIFRSFADVETVKSDQKISEIRISRQAGGFAFEFWCNGGDLNDIESLVHSFDGMLGKKTVPDAAIDPETESVAKANVIAQVLDNARQLSEAPASDIWAKPLEERLQLAKQWHEEVGVALIADQAIEVHRRHQAALRRLQQVRMDSDAHRFSQQDVIGLTTTACAKYWPLLSKLGLQTVICEEAGEVIEAHSLCTLFPTIKHAIFIGDPLQLRFEPLS